MGSLARRAMSTQYKIRAAEPTDIAAILDLAVEMVLASKSPLRPDVPDAAILKARRNNLSQLEWLLGLPEGGVFVAVDKGGELVGHVIVMGNNIDSVTEELQAWVYDLSVRKECWGQGLGRRLMKAAEDFAASLGLKWVGLGVTLSNERATSFYEEIGYRVERVQMLKRLDS